MPTLYGTEGISSVFLKRKEVMRDDLWTYNDVNHPALSASVAAANLARYNAIWFANTIPYSNLSAWDLIRTTRTDLLALYYGSCRTVKAPESFGELPYSLIDPTWYAVNKTAGNPAVEADRIAYSVSGDPTVERRWYLDPGNAACRTFVASWFADRALGKALTGTPPSGYVNTDLTNPFLGVALDNVDLGTHFYNIVQAKYSTWQYAGNQAGWDAAMVAFVSAIKTAVNGVGGKVIGNTPLEFATTYYDNTTQFTSLLTAMDGFASEVPMITSFGAQWADSTYDAALAQHKAILDAGLYDWWIHYPPTTDPGLASFLFNYCSFLLVAVPGQSFFYSTRGNDLSGSAPATPWFSEYYFRLGQPLGAKAKVNSCWVRSFDHGVVVVNPTFNPLMVSTVSTIIPAQTGMIFPVKKIGRLQYSPTTRARRNNYTRWRHW